jgi:putative hydrolase of the HAD superfamily
VLSSEKIGALKPNALPFDTLAAALNEPREKILYVGNSLRFDVRGARSAGLKTAYFMPFWSGILSKPPQDADFSFKSYRQLRKIVLE